MSDDDFDWGSLDAVATSKPAAPTGSGSGSGHRSGHGGACNLNALKHGLYAREVVLPGEDRATYDAMYLELQDEFEPKGRFEVMMVRRLAEISWRLGRAAAIEAGLLGPDMQGELHPRHDSGHGPVINTFRVALENTAFLDRLSCYEARLERAFHRSVEALERRQARRQARDGKRDGAA